MRTILLAHVKKVVIKIGSGVISDSRGLDLDRIAKLCDDVHTLRQRGYEVILVERSPSIGGHMIQLSETFPTLDCSQCILTPKMVEVSKHPKIKLMAYSEVEDVSGYVGNFRVKILRKPTYVDPFVNQKTLVFPYRYLLGCAAARAGRVAADCLGHRVYELSRPVRDMRYAQPPIRGRPDQKGPPA